MQIQQTNTPNQFHFEFSDGQTVTFEYQRPGTEVRFEFRDAVADDEATSVDKFEAALDVCIAATVGCDLDGPDGEPIDWSDGEALAEALKCETPYQARRFLFLNVHEQAHECDRLIYDYHNVILNADTLSDKKNDESGENSDGG